MKLQGHRPKVDKYFPHAGCIGEKKKKTTAAFVSLTLRLLCIWTIICMQSEPNDSLRDLPKQKFDLNQKVISAEMKED